MFARRAAPQNPKRVLCSSNAILFTTFRTLSPQWSTPNPFTINHCRTLFYLTRRRGCLTVFSLATRCLCSTLSPYIDFFSFQSLPPVAICNSFVLLSLQQCRGWVGGAARRGVKVLLELPVQIGEPKELNSHTSVMRLLSDLELGTNSESLFRQHHGGAAPQPQRPRGAALVYANLDEPA